MQRLYSTDKSWLACVAEYTDVKMKALHAAESDICLILVLMCRHQIHQQACLLFSCAAKSYCKPLNHGLVHSTPTLMYLLCAKIDCIVNMLCAKIDCIVNMLRAKIGCVVNMLLYNCLVTKSIYAR